MQEDLTDEMKQRINFCSRVVKTANMGQLCCFPTHTNMRFYIERVNRTPLYFSGIEAIENYCEGLLDKRKKNPFYRAHQSNYHKLYTV